MSEKVIAKQTPTPWEFYKPSGSRWHIGSKDGSHLVIGKINDDNSHTLGEANAAFIVEAANSYAALKRKAEAGDLLLEAAKNIENDDDRIPEALWAELQWAIAQFKETSK